MSTPVGELVVAKRFNRNFPISLPNRVSYIDLVELDMLDSDIIWYGLVACMFCI